MKLNVRRAGAAMIACALLASHAVADAASERDKKKAKVHAKNAAELFEAKSYELALIEFQKAYDLYPVPGLLYNMGQCHLFLGDHEKAIKRFEAFLAAKPDTPYKSDVERLIAEAKAELEKERKLAEAQKQPPPAIEPPPPPPVAVTPPPPPPEEEDDDPIYGKWWFWTIIGGVAVAAGGTAIAVVATNGEPTPILPSGDLGTLDRRQ